MNKEILVFFNARRCFALSTITLASLSLTGCFTEEIDSRQTQEIRGLIYKVHADDPFTGRILNYPMSVLGLFSVGTCSIDVKKGLPDGEMRCSDNADKLLAVGEFKAGKRDGKEEKFDAKTGNKIAEGNWKRGLQDGLLEQFNPQNGERTIEVHYTAGKKDGQERAWDEQGKVLIADLDWKNGKQTGFDNRGTQHRTYLQGEYHGPQKDYGIDGNRFYVSHEENYENGQLHGTQKRINARGNVTELSEFEHGKLKARTVDEYGNFDGKHLHHVSRLAIKEDVNQYIASDLSNDGLEQYWDNEGHLIRELQWNKGRLVSATATIWVGDKQISQYQGVARPGYDSHQDDVVKHGQERLYDRNGELDAVVVWSAGKVTNTIVNLPSDRRSQYPGKMAMLNPNMSWGNPVEEIPDFETPSRYGGGGFAIDYVTIVDTPAPGQPIQSQPVQKTVLAASTSNNVDACVQQKVDAVHAEDPDALVRADMLDEFEQDCQ